MGWFRLWRTALVTYFEGKKLVKFGLLGACSMRNFEGHEKGDYG